jgi:2-oxoacid:acceptor oxidoreductase gamma subunit (pyruvate/2-ketoisovalerate family)
VQAFPSFGAERTGVPVAAFLRIDRSRITSHYHVYEPDHVVVLDPVLVKTVNVTAGLREGGWIVVNSAAEPAALHLPETFNVATCDATAIALSHGLGSRTTPIVNTAMAGAFAAVSDLVQLDSVIHAIEDAVPVEVSANREAAIDAFGSVRIRPSAVRVTWP